MILKFIRVKGRSLEPLLMDGDIILAVGLRLCITTCQPGDLVIFQHPSYGQLVKQVERFSAEGDKVFVRGTRPTSLDSLEFGAVPLRSVTGKVIWRIAKSASSHRAQS